MLPLHPGDRHTGPVQAVILAAGEGRRLRPLTQTVPKALVPFFGRPLLDHAVARLVAVGVERIAVNACWLGERVAYHVEHKLAPRYPTVDFHVSIERTLLGTGGALWRLRRWLADAPLWVANADAVYTEPLQFVADRHAAAGADGTLMVTRDPALVTLRRLALSDDGWLTGMHEPWDAAGAVFCGVQIAEASILERLPPGPSCNLRQGYLAHLDRGVRVATWETHRFWADTGTPWRLADAHRRALSDLKAVLR